ncbi:hypothetical protein KTT_39950 [Tengunoibacter tsumagoiensis]|uniref:Uncharacterized protein n=2 Tax=Tengunoibacter tsumagoiensis TaxID=2014871 RepID=A0A402A502_9CHLR|nr:hypothetical protein KTT_39950 [Tengunoibacter tsumagoiensis]
MVLTPFEPCLNNKIQCTILTEIVHDDYIILTLAAEATYIVSSTLQKEKAFFELFFQKIVDLLDENIVKPFLGEQFIAATMGSEYTTNFEGDLRSAVEEESSEVTQWILPKNSGENFFPSKFSRYEKENTIIFRRLPYKG